MKIQYIGPKNWFSEFVTSCEVILAFGGHFSAIKIDSRDKKTSHAKL